MLATNHIRTTILPNGLTVLTERMEHVRDFIAVVRALFAKFLAETKKDSWKDKTTKIKGWAESRESF